jgi:hypothetical protein
MEAEMSESTPGLDSATQAVADRRDSSTRAFSGDHTVATDPPQADIHEARRTIFGVPLPRAIELGITALAVPTLAYLAIAVTRLDTTVTNANLPQLASDVSTTKDRVGRIFDAFPEMRARIAEEQLNRPVKLAILALRRVADNARVIHLVDLDNGRSTAFSFVAKGSESEKLDILIRGLAATLDRDPTPVSVYRLYLNDAKRPAPLSASYLDEELSFAIHRDLTQPQYERTVLLLHDATGSTPITGHYASSFDTFESLLSDLLARRSAWTGPRPLKKAP